MNHKVFLLTIYTFSATFICKSMEETHQFKELKAVENPFFAQYISHDRAVIASEYECCIVNPMTDEIVKRIEIRSPYAHNHNIHCTIHPNKKKFALTREHTGHMWSTGTVTIYDTITGEKEWSIAKGHSIEKAIFSSIDSTIFIKWCSEMIECNYVTDKEYEIDSNQSDRNIALHPTQNNVCVGIDAGKVFLYSLNESRDIRNRQTIKCDAQHYQYNHDGSFIIAYGGIDNDIKIITPLAEYNPCSATFNESIAIHDEEEDFQFCSHCGIYLKDDVTGFPHESIVKSILGDELLRIQDELSRIRKVIFYPKSSILAVLQKI